MCTTGANIINPTMINAGPYACGGTDATNGEKNSASTKHSAVTTDVIPVRPPASTPAADSRNAPDVVVPTSAASIVEIASTVIGRSICGRFPSSSSRFALADTPISVAIVSTKAMTNIVSTIGKNAHVNTCRKSSLNKIGEMLGGMPTNPCGGGATRNTIDSTVTTRIPARIAPGNRWTIKIVISTNPRIASSTGSDA